VGAGDGFEAADAGQLAFIGALVIEEAAVDDLDGEQGAGEVAGQPDLTVGAAAHATDQGVVRDDGCGQGLFGGERRQPGGVRSPSRAKAGVGFASGG